MSYVQNIGRFSTIFKPSHLGIKSQLKFVLKLTIYRRWSKEESRPVSVVEHYFPIVCIEFVLIQPEKYQQHTYQ